MAGGVHSFRVHQLSQSADGPLREPFTAYFQGGLTWPHAKLGIIKSLQSLVDKKLVDLNGNV